MAKMFYTMDETKSALGKSEDEIKQLSREGKLREFRDGPRIMFKADQVEALKSGGSAAAGAAADQVGLSAGDTHSGLGLMDSKTGSGADPESRPFSPVLWAILWRTLWRIPYIDHLNLTR